MPWNAAAWLKIQYIYKIKKAAVKMIPPFQNTPFSANICRKDTLFVFYIYIYKTKLLMLSSIVVVGSSNTDMVIKAEHLPAPGEIILGRKFLWTPVEKVLTRLLQQQGLVAMLRSFQKPTMIFLANSLCNCSKKKENKHFKNYLRSSEPLWC